MEKSIESIWKEGFLNTDALVAPKINDMYNRKSKSTVDKLLQMGKVNLSAIAIGALVVLLASFFLKTFLSGILLSALFVWLAMYGHRQAEKIGKVDTGINSYQYVSVVNQRLKETIAGYVRVYRFFYPAFLIVFSLGIWFSEFGQALSDKIITKYPDIDMMYSIPTYGLLGLLVVAGLTSLFAGSIYRLDLKFAYGNVFKKLDELVADMEQLKSEETK